MRRTSVLGFALGLTIWFFVLNLLVMLRVPVTDTYAILMIPSIYSMFLLPVRWVLVLILLIRAARTKPFRWLPRAPGLQATALVVIQVVLGLASFLGWWAVWWDTSKVAERIVGFFFCSFLPAVVVAFLVWRSAPQKTVYMGNG